jgi:hypothetical protein
MVAYRLFLIGEDGHFKSAVAVECASDEEALELARRDPTQTATEVWELGRFVGRTDAASEPHFA